MAHDQVRLVEDMRHLGIAAGDTLFVHSSYKSLGSVEGGAGTVIRAMADAVGPEGLLLLPAFNLIGDRDERANNWNVEETPSSVGWLTEFFRQLEDTHRSNHYSHSVCARGLGAEEISADHLSNRGMSSPWDREPWGKAYGADSPMIRAYDRGGKILMIGVDFYTSTYCHVVEVIYWNELRKQDAGAEFVWLDRTRLGAFWEAKGVLACGKIGDADCRLIGIRTYVDGLLEEVRENADAYDRVKLRTREAGHGEK